jgi:hypothetical protein
MPSGYGGAMPTAPPRDFYPRWLPDDSAIVYIRCMALWTCRARLVDC